MTNGHDAMTANPASMSRRKALRLIGAGAATAVGLPAFAIAAAKAVDELKPGEFIWNPERSPSGPVAIIVSLPEQRVYVYRNGIEIAVSTCSTGKPGHETPTGVFTILEKDKHHHSSTYNNAPMPNMNRLTWSGVALHAGQLPGYPASHGCVRLPLAFSEKLFGITHVGTPVIIANAKSDPASVVHPGQVLSADAEAEFDHVLSSKAKAKAPAKPAPAVAAAESAPAAPEPHLKPGDEALPAADATAPPPPVTAILVSSADKRIIILDHGEIVAEGTATIKDDGRPLGHHVFILSHVNETDRQLHWHSLGYSHEAVADVPEADVAVIQRIQGDHTVVQAIRDRMHAGTLLVTVDQPLHEETRTAKDFVVMATAES